MKRLIYLLLLVGVFASCRTTAVGDNMGILTVNFVTLNTIEGYDHVSKLKVYCDDVEVGESKEKKQSVKNSVSVAVPKGNHKIKVSLFAKYDGEWEERTIENNYSFDFSATKAINIKSKTTFDVSFNIDNNEVLAN